MVKTKKVSKIKVKKKKWFPIFTPGFLGEKEVGESYLGEPSAAIGRVVKINLMEITGSLKDQNLFLSLRVKEVKGNSLHTEVLGFQYVTAYLKKLTRKATSKIEDSFILKTKDKRARIKPWVITVFSVRRSLKKAIKKKLQERLKKEASKLTFDNFINELLHYKEQTELKKLLNKICPIREVIIKEIKLERKEKEKKSTEKEKEEISEETLKKEKGKNFLEKETNQQTEEKTKQKKSKSSENL